MSHKTLLEEITNLLNDDTSGIEEFNDEPDIDLENLDELFMRILDQYELSFCAFKFIKMLTILLSWNMHVLLSIIKCIICIRTIFL